MEVIDLRSDTVTRPTPAMRQLMAEAEVGDDVHGEDPSVIALEQYAADRLGFEATLFVSSGTQGNLLCLLSHCERGEEYVAGQEAHAYKFEGGGGAVLGGIQPQPVEMQPDGRLDLDRVRQVIKPDDFHFARTRLLCLENTHHGKVLRIDYLAEARALADEFDLAMHLDGARVFNAAVALGVDVKEITRYFDSVSVCLSKGLGAPVGSVIGGSAMLIAKANRWRKMIGGGMRQIGIVAAAGLHVMQHHVDRMSVDHVHARKLAEGLAAHTTFPVDPADVQTNMVFLPVSEAEYTPLRNYLAGRGILVGGRNPIRMVTHLDISSDDIDTAIGVFADYSHKHHNQAKPA